MALNVEMVGETEVRPNNINGSVETTNMRVKYTMSSVWQNSMKYKHPGKCNSEDRHSFGR